jgi:hypothetical protein
MKKTVHANRRYVTLEFFVIKWNLGYTTYSCTTYPVVRRFRVVPAKLLRGCRRIYSAVRHSLIRHINLCDLNVQSARMKFIHLYVILSPRREPTSQTPSESAGSTLGSTQSCLFLKRSEPISFPLKSPMGEKDFRPGYRSLSSSNVTATSPFAVRGQTQKL